MGKRTIPTIVCPNKNFNAVSKLKLQNFVNLESDNDKISSTSAAVCVIDKFHWPVKIGNCL